MPTIACVDPKTHVGGSTEKFRRSRRAARCHRRELHQENRRAYDKHASGRSHQPFDLPGQYRDEETGLSSNWHRTYDASLGRYLQEDPIRTRPKDSEIATSGPMSAEPAYTYASADPVNRSDFSGEQSEGPQECADPRFKCPPGMPPESCSSICRDMGAPCAPRAFHPHKRSGMGTLSNCKGGAISKTCTFQYPNGENCTLILPGGFWLCSM